MRNVFLNSLTIIFAVFLTLGLIEIFLIFKNSVAPNYDVEMWKYSKSLKVKSNNILIGHTHKKKVPAKNRAKKMGKVRGPGRGGGGDESCGWG